MKMEDVKINVVAFDFGEKSKNKDSYKFDTYPIMNKEAWNILNNKITELNLDLDIFVEKLLDYIKEEGELDFSDYYSPLGLNLETSDDYNDFIFFDKDVIKDFITLVSTNIKDITLVTALNTEVDGPEIIIGVYQTTKDIDKKIGSLIKISGRIKKKIEYKKDISFLESAITSEDNGIGDGLIDDDVSAIEFTENILEYVISSLVDKEEEKVNKEGYNLNINLSIKIEDESTYEKFKEDFSKLLETFGIEK